MVELLTERVNQLSIKTDNDLVSSSVVGLPQVLEILAEHLHLNAGFSFG